MTEDAKIVADLADPDFGVQYMLARIRVDAGMAAAKLFDATNAHIAAHGANEGDAWTHASLDAVEALADIATHGIDGENVLPPPADS